MAWALATTSAPSLRVGRVEMNGLALGQVGKRPQDDVRLAQAGGGGDRLARRVALAIIVERVLGPPAHGFLEFGMGQAGWVPVAAEIRRQPPCWWRLEAFLPGHGQHGGGARAQDAVPLGPADVAPDLLSGSRHRLDRLR